MILSTFGFFILFGMLADPANSYVYGAIHYIVLGFLIIFVNLIAIISFSLIIRDISNAAQHSETHHQERLDRLTQVFINLRRVSFIFVVISAVLGFSFGASSKLMRKSSYFLPLVWGSTGLFLLTHGTSSISTNLPYFLQGKGQVQEEHLALSGQNPNPSENPRTRSSIKSRFSFGPTTSPRSATQIIRKKWKTPLLTRVDELSTNVNEQHIME